MVSLNFLLLSLAVYTSAVRSSPVDGPSVVASGGRDGGRDGGRNGRDGDRDRDRVRVDVYMCIDKNFSGDCTTDKIYTGGCYDAPEDFRGRISAIRNDDRRDTECTWYNKLDCFGDRYRNQEDGNLADGNGRFNDAIRSYECRRR